MTTFDLSPQTDYFNILYGMSCVCRLYKPSEATKVQAINDMILFSVSGAGSLFSGLIFSSGGLLKE